MDRNTKGWVPASDSEGLVGMHGVAIVFVFAYREYICVGSVGIGSQPLNVNRRNLDT